MRCYLEEMTSLGRFDVQFLKSGEQVQSTNDLAQWLSWLERRPVTAEAVGSSPSWVVRGILAQLGEHLPYKQRVTGSSPVGPTNSEKSELSRCGSIGRAADL